MTRDSSGKQGNLRERIAHLAARIIAEDGVDDFAYAKRKAARQAGAPNARVMPDNAEIEAALATYRQLYQAGRHEPVLAQLRQAALEVMRELQRFNPHLTGTVLSGVAGRHSDIELQVFVDSAKDLEVFLLNRSIRYRADQIKVYANQAEKVVPTFTFEHGDTAVRLAVLDAQDLRYAIRTSPLGRPLERAPIPVVEQLL
jgi:hypothetical protein